MNALLQDIYATFGWKTRMIAPLIGRYAYWMLRKEEERLSRGWVHEPVSFYEKNATASDTVASHPSRIRIPAREVTWVSGKPASEYH
jgi:hypothetical protein